MNLLLVGLLIMMSPLSYGQQPKEKRVRAKDAIRAAQQATSEEAKEQAYRQIDVQSIEDDADVKAIYGELANRHKGFRKDRPSKKQIESAHQLAEVLAKCREPKYHAVIKQLLEKEEDEVPAYYMGPWGAKSQNEASKEVVKFDRLKALTEAAGEGKNEAALPPLRKIRKKGGEAGKLAEKAIGQIGRDEDFEEFIREIKSDPKSRTNLTVFGQRAAERIIKEIDDPAVKPEEKTRLVGSFPQVVPRKDARSLVRLLKHNDRHVVSVISRTLSNSLGAEDEDIIRDLLKNPNRAVKGEALLAIDRVWDVKYLPDLLEILRTDTDNWRRSFVVHMLGKHKVVAATSALQDAEKNDQSSEVREAAAFALKRIRK